MKNISLLILAVATGLMVACDHHDTLPPYTTSTIFNASGTMTHDKDTIRSTGDTVKISAEGRINDTSKTYTISASLKAVDTVNATLLGAEYIKTLTVKFDTAKYAATQLYHWTATMLFPLPPIPAKTRIKTTAVFTFGLNLSSQTGNQTGIDKLAIYSK